MSLLDLAEAPNLASAEPHIPGSWDSTGSHLVMSTNRHLLDELIRQGAIDPASLPDALHNPEGRSNGELQDAFEAALRGHGVEEFNDALTDDYGARLNNLKADETESLDDLVDHGKPPGPG